MRYADDFLLLVGASPGPDQYERARVDAEKEKEKAAVAALLVGSQAGLLLARLLRLVERLSLAEKEASVRTGESAEGVVPTLEGARRVDPI